ncbi:hypothetical protein [Streptomyces sp. MK7]|uniref:hypothetical protein n=1 Tax=Streptomyces sp. MK7 TaxID=3067635 RepID=UPI00292D8CC1|nr:hypothetical protein [Streptomyces sp. MK7]
MSNPDRAEKRKLPQTPALLRPASDLPDASASIQDVRPLIASRSETARPAADELGADPRKSQVAVRGRNTAIVAGAAITQSPAETIAVPWHPPAEEGLQGRVMAARKRI